MRYECEFEEHIGLVKDRELLDFWIAHSHAVIAEHEGKFAVYLGPQPETQFQVSPRAALRAWMEKEKRKGKIITYGSEEEEEHTSR